MSVPILMTAEILKAVMGHVASGPAGFGVYHEVASDARLDANSNGVEMQVNKQSLAAATANHESGSNKPIAQAVKAQEQHQALLKKTGVDQTFARVNSRGIAARNQLRLPFTQSAAQKQTQQVAPPRQGHEPRALFTVRATVDAIKQFRLQAEQLKRVPPTVVASFNPQQLPQAIKDSEAEKASRNGEKNPTFGPVKYQSQVRATYSKWSHTLIGYVEGPKLNHQA